MSGLSWAAASGWAVSSGAAPPRATSSSPAAPAAVLHRMVLPPCLHHKENKFTVVTVLSPRRKTWSPSLSLFCDIKPFPLFILGGGLLRILNCRDHQLSYQTIGPFSRLYRWEGTP